MKRINCIVLALVTMLIATNSFSANEDFNVEVDQLLYSDELQDDKEEPTPRIKRRKKIKSLSSLKYLAPFNDIAIIQKKYLAKTERFEISPGLGVILNDAFFVNQILSFRVGYHLTEKWGLEFNYANLSQSTKKVTDDLADLGVTTSSIVIPKSFIGIDVKWTPFYGKMSFLDASIVPYDTYFIGGLGQTTTNQEQKPVTAHFALGQNFALSKSLAIRWDTSFFWYQAETSNLSSSLYTNIHFTIGASYFFPEAKYR